MQSNLIQILKTLEKTIQSLDEVEKTIKENLNFKSTIEEENTLRQKNYDALILQRQKLVLCKKYIHLYYQTYWFLRILETITSIQEVKFNLESLNIQSIEDINNSLIPLILKHQYNLKRQIEQNLSRQPHGKDLGIILLPIIPLSLGCMTLWAAISLHFLFFPFFPFLFFFGISAFWCLIIFSEHYVTLSGEKAHEITYHLENPSIFLDKKIVDNAQELEAHFFEPDTQEYYNRLLPREAEKGISAAFML